MVLRGLGSLSYACLDSQGSNLLQRHQISCSQKGCIMGTLHSVGDRFVVINLQPIENTLKPCYTYRLSHSPYIMIGNSIEITQPYKLQMFINQVSTTPVTYYCGLKVRVGRKHLGPLHFMSGLNIRAVHNNFEFKLMRLLQNFASSSWNYVTQWVSGFEVKKPIVRFWKR